MALFTSRGYESVKSKLFMRGTVIAADLVVFLPAVYAFVTTYYASLSWSKRVPPTTIYSFFFFSVVWYMLNIYVNIFACRGCLQMSAFFLISLQPALLLIDHGHFQYAQAIYVFSTTGMVVIQSVRCFLVLAWQVQRHQPRARALGRRFHSSGPRHRALALSSFFTLDAA